MKLLNPVSCIVVATLSASAFAKAEVTVKPVGLQIVWDDGGEKFGGFHTFNSEQGVSVAFLLTSDGPSFIDVNDDIKLDIGGAKGECHFFGQQSDISKDGKQLSLKFKAKGAKMSEGKLPVSGEIEVVTAGKKGEVSTDLLELKEGTVVEFPEEAGLPKFTVSKIGKPDWGEEKFEVTLKTNKDFQKPVSVTFIDEEGKKHPAKQGGWSRMGFGKIVKVEIGYKIKAKIGKAKIVVEYWQDMKKIKVPVDFTLGMDGPKSNMPPDMPVERKASIDTSVSNLRREAPRNPPRRK